MRRFEGRNVIVTGASSGIGWAIAHAFVDEGATVFAVARRGELLDEMRAASSAPARVHTAVVDVGVPEQARGMVRDGDRRPGPSARAGEQRRHHALRPVLEMEEETWRDTLAVNLDGPFFASQAAARHMVEQGGGVIVNIASANAFRVESPAANYNTSKAALVMMTRCFAHELGHLGRAGLLRGAGADGHAGGGGRTHAGGVPPRVRRVLQSGAAAPPGAGARSRPQSSSFSPQTTRPTSTARPIIVDGGELTGEWYDPADNPTGPEAVSGDGTKPGPRRPDEYPPLRLPVAGAGSRRRRSLTVHTAHRALRRRVPARQPLAGRRP